MKADQEYLQQLKSKNDLVDVVGSYVHLEKKGCELLGVLSLSP